jgi:pimeloyl-ACP methyl ester carboxylesterase
MVRRVSNVGPVSLSFDVTDALPADVTEGNSVSIAAWLFFPDDLTRLSERPVTISLLNGGSYDKRYFHVEIPGHPGYSAARYLADRGSIVVVLDHLGVGESSRVPTQNKATRQVAALANHAAVSQFFARLQAGDLHPGLPAFPTLLKIGGGHSMGGMQTIVQQATQHSYEAVMILGYTAQGVHFTMGGKKLRAADFLPPEGTSPDYSTNDRSTTREGFHWEDVPEAVMLADDALATETPSKIGLDSIRTGIVVGDAAKINVPIYMCLGERDVSPDPHAEPGYFRACSDFTLHILPRSGHCQNFASTRHLMWDRMHNWTRSIAV